MRLILDFLAALPWRLAGVRRRAPRVAIRPIRPDDRERLVQAFRALDAQSVYQRFFFPKRELSDEELRQTTECDGKRVVALVATTGNGERQAIVGLGQYVRRHGASAEVAFAVASDFQGRGIASTLLRRLIRSARRQGISRFEADVLDENPRMLAVLRHCGLPVQQTRASGVVHVTMTLSGRPERPSPVDHSGLRPNRDVSLTTPTPTPNTVPR